VITGKMYNKNLDKACIHLKLRNEGNLRHDLYLSGYPQFFVNSFIHCKDRGCPNKGEKPLGSEYHICEGVSEKCIRTGNCYDIRMIFKTKHTLRSSLMKTRLERDPNQTAQCIYSIPCECGRSYIGKTGKPLAKGLHVHRHSLKGDLPEKLELAQGAYE
jgi:hypothetical protein